jgi:hypothetical protein
MKTPELGPADAIYNAMIDLDDIYAEVGKKILSDNSLKMGRFQFLIY